MFSGLSRKLIDDIGTSPQEILETEIRRRYRAETDENPTDGYYAGVVMCRHCEPNHEIEKSGWIFAHESEALSCAEYMLGGIVASVKNMMGEIDETVPRILEGVYEKYSGNSED